MQRKVTKVENKPIEKSVEVESLQKDKPNIGDLRSLNQI